MRTTTDAAAMDDAVAILSFHGLVAATLMKKRGKKGGAAATPLETVRVVA